MVNHALHIVPYSLADIIGIVWLLGVLPALILSAVAWRLWFRPPPLDLSPLEHTIRSHLDRQHRLLVAIVAALGQVTDDPRVIVDLDNAMQEYAFTPPDRPNPVPNPNPR